MLGFCFVMKAMQCGIVENNNGYKGNKSMPFMFEKN